MKEPLSPPLYLNKLERPQEYPIKLMQHQQDAAQLAQKIHQIIVSNGEAQTRLQQIAQVIAEAFRVDCCCLTSVTFDHADPEINAYWLATPQPTHQNRSLEELSLISQFADTPTIEEISAVEKSIFRIWQDLPLTIAAGLTTPTRFQGKNNGALSIICSQTRDWHQWEKELLDAVSGYVAIAISQITQAQKLVSYQQQIYTSTQYQALLNRLTLVSRSNLDLNEILNLAIAGTAETLQVERGLIVLLKYADPLFKTRSLTQIPKAKATVVSEWSNNYWSSRGDTSKNKKANLLNQFFWLGECSLCQSGFENAGKPVLLADKQSLLDFAPDLCVSPLFNLDQLPALLLMPLESQGKVLGFLVLQQANRRHWQPEELKLVEMVSARVSNAIIQTQTLRQVQSLVDERTAQLQRSLQVQGKLYEKLRQYNEQLQAANKLKDEFVANVSDRLRHPLTSMNVAIRMLRQPGLQEQRQAKYLDILEQQCTQEINLVNDLLKLQQLESHQATLQLATIDLNSHIQNLRHSFTETWGDKGLTFALDIPESLPLQTDVESFDRILKELLTNAGKYSATDTTVCLKVTHQVSEQIDQIVLSLTNKGRDIPPEDLPYIFDKFQRGKGASQQGILGTGLGLALVKCLVQHLSGAIAVSSNPTEDAKKSEICFTLTLPQFSVHDQPYE
jgi:signal transduction histidine kinase